MKHFCESCHSTIPQCCYESINQEGPQTDEIREKIDVALRAELSEARKELAEARERIKDEEERFVAAANARNAAFEEVRQLRATIQLQSGMLEKAREAEFIVKSIELTLSNDAWCKLDDDAMAKMRRQFAKLSPTDQGKEKL